MLKITNIKLLPDDCNLECLIYRIILIFVQGDDMSIIYLEVYLLKSNNKCQR